MRRLRTAHLGSSASRLTQRLDMLLTPQRVRVYPLILFLGFGIALVISWFVASGRLPLPDFAARWTAGRMLLDGADDLYSPAAQARVQTQLLGATSLSWFVSPPFVAVMFVPFALLPYPVACVVWTLISAAALALALRISLAILPSGDRPRALVIAVPMVGSYPVLELLGGGQDSSLVLLFVVASLRWLANGRAVSAGLVFALGLMKPQLIFMAPIALLLLRQWRAIGSFLIGAVVLVAIGIAAVGLPQNLAWLDISTSPLYAEAVQRGQAWKSVSVPGWLLSALPPDVGHWGELLAYAAGVVLVLVSIASLSRGRPSASQLWAFAGLTTAIASPHFMVYDLVLIFPAVLVLMEHLWSADTRVLLAAAFVLLWLVAPLHVLTTSLPWPLTLIGAPWTAGVLLTLWIRFRRHCVGERPPLQQTV